MIEEFYNKNKWEKERSMDMLKNVMSQNLKKRHIRDGVCLDWATIHNYAEATVNVTLGFNIDKQLANDFMSISDIADLILYSGRDGMHAKPIEKVIFNDPATIIIWGDKTKTVVKCQEGEPFDPEKGFAMAVVKKLYGNKGNYYKIFRKILNEYKPHEEEETNESEI